MRLSMTHREELTLKAVEILNKTKGINYRLKNVKEESDGEVSFECTYPTGWAQKWSWPACWFDPSWDGPSPLWSGVPEEVLEKVNQYTGDEKVVVRMMAYLWTVRNHKR